jgi:ribosomal-protein-alanine N-acetyltransferase
MSMTIELQFKRLNLEAINRVIAIEQADGDVFWNRAHFEHEMSSEIARFFVLEQAGNILGYGGFWKIGYEAQITNLVIAREQRRKGLGQRFLEHLLRQAKTEGCTVVTLEVRSRNAAAQKLYARAGFTVQGKRPRAYTQPPDDAVHMEKTL